MSSRSTGSNTRQPRARSASSSPSVGGSVFVPTNAAIVRASKAPACSASRSPAAARAASSRAARRARRTLRSAALASAPSLTAGRLRGELAAQLGERALLAFVEHRERALDTGGVLGEEALDDVAPGASEGHGGGAPVVREAAARDEPPRLERADDLGRVRLGRAQPAP